MEPFMDTLRAARYPFLPEAAAFAEKESEGLEQLLSSPSYMDARKRGLARVMGALENHEIPDATLIGTAQDYNRLMEVLSYPYARMLVSVIDDRLLTKKYALAEAVRMNTLLHQDRDSLSTVAADLEVKAQNNPDGTVSIHFADFLRYSYILKAVEWKLINMDVRRGFVRLESTKFDRLLQNALQNRIEDELPLTVPDRFKPFLQADIDHISMVLAETKRRLSPTGGEAVKDGYLPPCIRAIIASAQAGMNLPHSARFALVSFLHALGMNYDQIIGVFAQSPDFDESVSAYQIKHITGELNGTEGYTPPECGTMKTNGICFNPDELCEHIHHPLNYYRIRAREGKQRNAPPAQPAELPKN